MKRLVIVLFTALAAAPTYSQQKTISLSESKKAALAYSKAIKNGALGIESAQADVLAAKSAYYPSVQVVGVGAQGFKDFISPIPPLLTQGIDNFYFTGAQAMEPVYAGGKVRTSNELAALQLEASRVRAQQSTDSVLLLTEQKYWNLINLQEQYKVIIANEHLLDTVLKQQNDLLASGLIARNDQLKVKVQRSKLLLNKSKLENGRKLALLDFCFYTGMPYDSLLIMEDTLNASQLMLPDPAGPDLTLSANTNYSLMKMQVSGEKLQTKLTKGDYMPTVSVGVNAAVAGSVGNGIGSKFMPLALGTVSVPISDWWGKGKQKLKQRALSEQAVVNRFEDVENQLKVGITKSWYDVSDATKQIAFAIENLAQATENLKVSQDNYASGLSSITELMDAQALYQEASSELVTALAGYRNKAAAYQFMIGKAQ
ncbi:TolC family protein [Filimonas effusa]|nr:TolC family protein [Filimonas effusa]